MLPLSERRPPGARRFALSAWFCALSLAVLAAVVLAVAPQSPAVASTTAATTVPEVAKQVSTVPFKARENYYCTRIPAVVTSKTGVLLAFAEGRTRLDSTGCHDVGDNDLVLKRSLDGGTTWQALQIVVGGSDELAHGNPAPVVDAVTGRITLLYSSSDWNHDPVKPSRTGYERTVHAVHSMDGGVTWSASAPQPQLKAAGWGWVSTGPGHGIQLSRGPHHGRLIVPGDHTAGGDTTAGGQLYISDDGGLTWTLGATSEASKSGAYPAELTVVETVDGNVYVNARNSAPTHCQTNEHRLAAVGTDGGGAFAAPFTQVADLDTSPVFGSLLRLHAVDQDGKPDQLLYSGASRLGPSALEDRRELAVRSSYDEGKTWQTVGTLVSAARTGYSDLTLLPNGSIGIVYETAGNIPHGNVAFAAFTEQAMDGSRTELRRPRTSDTRVKGPGEAGNHAIVHGGARLGTRLDGVAMEFDGEDDYLRLVCSPSLRVDDKDFTVTAWFKHSATTGTLPIIWAYGMPGTDPLKKGRHFSVRAEPGSNVLRGTVGTDIGSTEVTLPSSYNDGQWHHVVFTRQGLTIRLAVDGGPAATATMPAGASASERNLTPAAEFNIHIGARPDFPNQPVGVAQLFRGALDDVRLFDTALTTGEAADVKAGSLEVAKSNEKLRLGFSTIW
ncbi:sialidase family protein [Streptomyces sp. TLI_105]|uniref:sialidase family protein n=1 Tax=Streptomyces sp. TLI_105 TaxID=1881019 RepID=UPI00089974C0|nr:sialidase family protein [Streptomyces sp. TLI_105]SED96005.1 sialidase-1 [Streptomyces sp. TLI_105]